VVIQVLVRGRYVELDDVRVRQDGSNAWSFTIPLDTKVCRRVRRGERMEHWDGAIFLIDEVQSAPCVATGEGRGSVTVSVWT